MPAFARRSLRFCRRSVRRCAGKPPPGRNDLREHELFGDGGTRRDRGRSAAAASSAINTGARRRVRAPADLAARVAASRRSDRQTGRRHRPRFRLRARESNASSMNMSSPPRPKKRRQVEQLKRALAGASPRSRRATCRTRDVSPLHALSSARICSTRKWTSGTSTRVLTQQVREPAQERALRDLIPRLTQIEDEVSQRVRQQYEENPYPRWVHVAGQVAPMPIDQYLRDQFPDRRLHAARQDRARSTC